MDEEALAKPLLVDEEHQPAESSDEDDDGSSCTGTLRRHALTREFILNYIALCALVIFFAGACGDRYLFCDMAIADPVWSTSMSGHGCDAPFLFDGPVLCSLFTLLFHGAHLLSLAIHGQVDVGPGTWWGFWFSIILPLNYQAASALWFELSDIRALMPSYVALVVISSTCVSFWALAHPFYVSVWASILVMLGYMAFLGAIAALGDIHVYPVTYNGEFIETTFLIVYRLFIISVTVLDVAHIMYKMDDDGDDGDDGDDDGDDGDV